MDSVGSEGVQQLPQRCGSFRAPEASTSSSTVAAGSRDGDTSRSEARKADLFTAPGPVTGERVLPVR